MPISVRATVISAIFNRRFGIDLTLKKYRQESGERSTLSSAAVDGYDLLIYHAALSGNARQILTDDVDYGELSDVQIFTANEKLIDLAREQGKLRAR
jgi:hypothetical protein